MKTVTIHTDQNVKIEVELASISQRIGAALLDAIILVSYYAIMMFIVGMIFLSTYRESIFEERNLEFWEVMYYIIIFLPFLLYTPLMEYLTKGQTIGKMAVGIRVVKTSGENAAFRDYFTRWLFRPIEFYILNFAGLGLLMLVINFFVDVLLATVSARSQRLGGIMSNTIVIRKSPQRNYSIRDVLSIKTNDNHKTTYPGVIQFTDEDMMLIKKTIARVEKHQNPETKQFAIALAQKTAEQLGMQQPPTKVMRFLRTVLDDYIVLTR